MASKNINDNCWTYDRVKEVALSCEYKSDFREKSQAAYGKAHKKGWLKDFTWLKDKKRPNGYWNNYDNCYNEAKKYKTRTEFMKNGGGAYSGALSNKWLDDYYWFLSADDARREARLMWTYDKCYEEAKKYSTKIEFQKGSPSAYDASRRYKWLDDYTWFVELRKPNGYWTKERCYEEAKKYKTRTEFMNGCSRAYSKSLDENWIDDYTWFESVLHNDWTFEECYAEAKKYTRKVDFKEGNGGAYAAALKYKWLKDFTWFKKGNREGNTYCVYSYEDVENKYVYVGLTCEYKRRDREHRNGICQHGVKKYDSLYKYFNGKIPEGKIKMDGLTSEEAKYYEGWYAEKYIEDGWTLINKAKTGSLGTAIVKWDYDACYAEAKKYRNRNSFKEGCHSGYGAALRNNWIDDYTWFETQFVWTYELCYEEAKKYSRRNDFYKGSSRAYYKSLENNWIDDFTWLERIKEHPDGYWNNYDNCYNEAKKYQNISAFFEGSGGAYNGAFKNGWLKDYTWFKRPQPKRKWTYDKCKEEAQKCGSRSEFHKKNPSAYQTSWQNGWLNDFFQKAA